jgi:hypothetical protein
VLHGSPSFIWEPTIGFGNRRSDLKPGSLPWHSGRARSHNHFDKLSRFKPPNLSGTALA